MAILQNSINANSSSPLITTDGGTGASAPTAHTLPVAEGANAFTFLGPLTNGQLLIGSTGADPVAAAVSAGVGISVTNAAGSITIAVTAGGMTWVDQTGASVTMATNTGYTSDDGATLVTFTLPTSCVIGDAIEIQGKAAGLWKIAQAASQQIFFGNTSSTAGTSGTIASTLQYDCIRLRALTSGATSTWSVVSAVGNITVT